MEERSPSAPSSQAEVAVAGPEGRGEARELSTSECMLWKRAKPGGETNAVNWLGREERTHRLSLAHRRAPSTACFGAPASWSAPVLWRFSLGRDATQSARGLAHSKTLRPFA